MDYSPWSERDIGHIWKLILSPKLERPCPPYLVCMHISFAWIFFHLIPFDSTVCFVYLVMYFTIFFHCTLKLYIFRTCISMYMCIMCTSNSRMSWISWLSQVCLCQLQCEPHLRRTMLFLKPNQSWLFYGFIHDEVLDWVAQLVERLNDIAHTQHHTAYLSLTHGFLNKFTFFLCTTSNIHVIVVYVHIIVLLHVHVYIIFTCTCVYLFFIIYRSFCWQLLISMIILQL